MTLDVFHVGSLAAAGLLLAASSGRCATIIDQTFNTPDPGWTAIGNSGKISVTHDQTRTRDGRGALEFDYSVAKNEMNAAILPTPGGQIAGMKTMHFWVKSDYTTEAAVIMQEQDSGRYISLFLVPGDQWQEVRLTPADFQLSSNAGDPPDPDGKLDLDQVQGIGLVDVGQMFAQSDQDKLKELLHVKLGPHTLLVDHFTLTDEPTPEPANKEAWAVVIDRFTRPQLSWMAIGTVSLSRVDGKPMGGPALRADYHQALGQIHGWMKQFTPGKLAGTDALIFNAASLKPANVMVQVEETDGGKYNATLALNGDSTPQEVELKFAELTPSDDSKDTNGRLDVEKIKQILIMDSSDLTAAVTTDNTIWINNLRARKAD